MQLPGWVSIELLQLLGKGGCRMCARVVQDVSEAAVHGEPGGSWWLSVLGLAGMGLVTLSLSVSFLAEMARLSGMRRSCGQRTIPFAEVVLRC